MCTAVLRRLCAFRRYEWCLSLALEESRVSEQVPLSMRGRRFLSCLSAWSSVRRPHGVCGYGPGSLSSSGKSSRIRALVRMRLQPVHRRVSVSICPPVALRILYWIFQGRQGRRESAVCKVICLLCVLALPASNVLWQRAGVVEVSKMCCGRAPPGVNFFFIFFDRCDFFSVSRRPLDRLMGTVFFYVFTDWGSSLSKIVHRADWREQLF